MRPSLLQLLAAIVLVLPCLQVSAADLFQTVWKLGVDDDSRNEFGRESYSPNASPGSASARDDDYYFAGTYAIGTVNADEDLSNFERAVSSGDPNVRIHFNLTASQAVPQARFRLRFDMIQAGWWDRTISASGPGYAVRDLALRFNGTIVLTANDVSADRVLDVFFTGQEVTPIAGENVVELSRTDGFGDEWIQLDYAQLDVDADALTDGDSDTLPRYWEESFGMDDSVSADALSDADVDSRTAAQEYQEGTSPVDNDSDNDQLGDGREAALGTDPRIRDTDGDSLLDGHEAVGTPASNPLLTDTDGDGGNDAWERHVGTDPGSNTSVPWQFPGAIGLNIVSTRRPEAALSAYEIAGSFPQQHWNNTAALPDYTNAGGTLNDLLDSTGATTNIDAAWTAHTTFDTENTGNANADLMNGYLNAEGDLGSGDDVSLTMSNIPGSMAAYDVYVYVGSDILGGTSRVRLNGQASTDRFFRAATERPFLKFIEATASTEADATFANVVRFANVSGSSFTVSLGLVATADRTGILGIQIVDTALDSDGDTNPDAWEILNGLNPAISDGQADPDADGLTNTEERAAGTHPLDPDTDDDELADGAEIVTSPLNPDGDDDGILDGVEQHHAFFPSDPNLADTDGDGVDDGDEINAHSDPDDGALSPAGFAVPTYDAGSRTWRWTVDNVRALWNHDLAPVSDSSGDDVFGVIVWMRDVLGWDRQLRLGVRYREGTLTYQFVTHRTIFQRSSGGSLYRSDWSNPPNDLANQFGFSMKGRQDDSDPLRFVFTAHRPNPAINAWTVTFEIYNVKNAASPLLVASHTENDMVAGHPQIEDPTANGFPAWEAEGEEDESFDDDRSGLYHRDGISVGLTRDPIGPADGDNDSMPDSWENAHGFNPNDPSDADDDPDNDGLLNCEEHLHGTDPRDDDSDDDGAKDGVEIAHGSNPLTTPPALATDPGEAPPYFFSALTGTSEDLDGNGLSDAWQARYGANGLALDSDTDGDGQTAAQESEAGTDPFDGTSLLAGEIDLVGNDVEIEWPASAYKSYAIETNDSPMGGGTWTPANGSQTSSNGLRKQTIAGGAAGTRQFFRINVQDVDADFDGVTDWSEDWLGTDGTSSNSNRQSVVTQANEVLSGDFVKLMETLQGATDNGAWEASTASSQPSRVQAARFLTQASFGPTLAEIDRVAGMGFEAWIDEQLEEEPSLHQPYLAEIKADYAGRRLDRTYNVNEMNGFIFGNNVTTPFARAATSGDDQLRQRVAFALSQILVISRRDAQLDNRPEGVANYYDIFVRRAFGNYRDILLEVTLHPCMGWYLSHVGNQKADPSIPRFPDENYAREIMQLFTIGLWRLHPDGTLMLDAQGEPISTYDNGDITELARVFTGLSFDVRYRFGTGGWLDEHYQKPMRMYPEYHDFGSKTLLNGFHVPARAENEENGLQDVRDAVDSLFDHPNTPPFVCRRLIQFFVTSNPSPAYVERVQNQFVDNGKGVRGDLGAVIKAILLDPEARDPQHAAQDHFGKLKEPVIRTMALGRAFDLGKAHPNVVWWNWEGGYYDVTFQEPTNSPTVFNFYTPEYQPPGPVREQGYVGPAFQIMDTFSSISMANLLWRYLEDGFQSGGGLSFPLDFGAVRGAAVDSPEALADRMDLLFCQGNMSARVRQIIISTISDPELNTDERILLAAYLAMESPDGAIQR